MQAALYYHLIFALTPGINISYEYEYITEYIGATIILVSKL